MASKPVTEEKCFERTTKMTETLGSVKNSVDKLNVTMNGKLGVVETLLKVAEKVETIEGNVGDIKENGNLKGKDKTKVTASAYAATAAIIVALISLAQHLI